MHLEQLLLRQLPKKLTASASPYCKETRGKISSCYINSCISCCLYASSLWPLIWLKLGLGDNSQIRIWDAVMRLCKEESWDAVSRPRRSQDVPARLMTSQD